MSDTYALILISLAKDGGKESNDSDVKGLKDVSEGNASPIVVDICSF